MIRTPFARRAPLGTAYLLKPISAGMALATGPNPSTPPAGFPPPGPPMQPWPGAYPPFPYPAGGHPWPGSAGPPAFRSLAPKRRAIAILAIPVGLGPILFLAFHAAVLLTAFEAIAQSGDSTAGKQSLPPGFASTLAAAFVAVFAAALVMLGSSVAQALVVGFWGRDAANNVRAFGAQGLTWSPGWAIGGWFIPYANYVIPFLVLREIWRAAEGPLGAGAYWRQVPIPGWTGWWWGLWVASSVAPGLFVVPVEFLIILNGWPTWIIAVPLLASLFVVGAAYVLFMRFVDHLTRRQQDVAQQLGLA